MFRRPSYGVYISQLLQVITLSGKGKNRILRYCELIHNILKITGETSADFSRSHY